MKRKSIRLVIFSIAIALIGLVSIQVIWIENAIELKENNFKRSVQEAMNNVIFKLEKIEVAARIKNKITSKKQINELFNSVDSINTLIFKEFGILMTDSIIAYESFSGAPNKSIQLEVSKIEGGREISKIDTNIGLDSTFVIENSGRGIENATKSLIKIKSKGKKPQPSPAYSDSSYVKKLMKKTSLISDIFNDLIGFNHPQIIENRINVVFLDSLIKYELRNKGIETEYEFGIYSPFRKDMVYEKTGKFHEQLLKESYSYSLFPNDLFVTPDYLVVFFPNQRHYLLSQISLLLSIAAILIIVIIISFIYTITIIYKQKKLSELKNDFVNNMTHEFKTPISTISLACEALQDDVILKTPQLFNNYISIINNENKRLGTLAEKVLQTAVIDKGQLHLKIEPIDIKIVIQKIISNFSLQIEKRNGKLKQLYNTENLIIHADKIHITNVFYNLLDNAVKYTLGVPIIHIVVDATDEGVVIAIKDNGIGISAANQKKIFEKLYRVPTGNIHNVKGFGLGLHYVRAIIDLHKGKIHVDSELKKGTTISIFLPQKHE